MFDLPGIQSSRSSLPVVITIAVHVTQDVRSRQYESIHLAYEPSGHTPSAEGYIYSSLLNRENSSSHMHMVRIPTSSAPCSRSTTQLVEA